MSMNVNKEPCFQCETPLAKGLHTCWRGSAQVIELKKVFSHGVERAAVLQAGGIVLVGEMRYRWHDDHWAVVL